MSFWCFNIDSIGIHGDEAWLGLRGVEYLKNGIESPYGMNKYTGILQSFFNFLIFKYFSIGVIQLRVTGVILNSVSLAILLFSLVKNKMTKIALCFSLFFAQSSLYLLDAKVAWEVCSFNLFFMTLVIVSLQKLILRKKQFSLVWAQIFLIGSFLGAYNHIIFSSLLISLEVGIFLWMKYNNQALPSSAEKFFTLILLSNLNVLLLFILMHLWIDSLWAKFHYLCFLLPFAVTTIEVTFFNKLVFFLRSPFHRMMNVKISQSMIKGFLFFSLLIFVILHGIAFVQILTQKIMVLRIFSYELPQITQGIFLVSAILLSAYLLYALYSDVIRNPNDPWVFLLLSYFGIFCIYTRGNSPRYYLILSVLVFLYLSFKISQKKSVINTLVILMITANAALLQMTLWQISLDKNRTLKPRLFKIGITHLETSAHFLPFAPVLDYINQHHIGYIETKEPFFIGTSFEFYKKIYPQINNYPNSMSIEYSYNEHKNGFSMVQLPSRINGLRP